MAIQAKVETREGLKIEKAYIRIQNINMNKKPPGKVAKSEVKDGKNISWTEPTPTDVFIVTAQFQVFTDKSFADNNTPTHIKERVSFECTPNENLYEKAYCELKNKYSESEDV